MIENIKVKPKRIIVSKDKLVLANICEPNFKILVDTEFGHLGMVAYKKLIDCLSDIVKCDASGACGKINIVLKISNIVSDEIKRNVEQAYKVYVDNTSVRIIGFSDLGLYYGVNTFLQALDVTNNRVEIQKMLLLDFPDLRTRGCTITANSSFDLMDLDDLKSIIDDLASKKLNQLALPFYGFDSKLNASFGARVAKRFYSPKNKGWITDGIVSKTAKDDFADALIKYGIEHGVEVYPYIDVMNANLMYDPSHNVISEDNGNDKHMFCVFKDTSYAHVFDIFDRLIDNCLKPNNIESINVCSGENRSELKKDVIFNRCICKECKRLTPADKTFRYIISILRYLKERGMRNVYISPDFLLGTSSVSKFKELLEMENLIDVVVFEIPANADATNEIKALASDTELRKILKPISSPTQDGLPSGFIENTFEITDKAIKYGSEGLQLYSLFDRSSDPYHNAAANFAWNIRGSFNAASFKNSYLLSEFSLNEKELTEAFRIYLDFKTSSSGLERVTSILNNIYFFDKFNCPKHKINFPGNIIKRMTEERRMFNDELREAYELSNKAYAIFKGFERRICCNFELTHRFALEMKYYRELTSLLISLLDLHDLSISKKLTPSVIKNILFITNERKQSIIELMRELESALENFVVPNILRGLSVILQVFIDIEAHYEIAKGKERRINMTDLRPIASKLFEFII